MKKQFISMALATMLLSTAVLTGATTNCYAADSVTVDNTVKSSVQKDMSDTASYVFSTIQTRISADNYTFSYNDYVQAMLCLKAGQKNDEAVKILSDYLATENNAMLSSTSNGTKSLSLAAAILFLNETGVDVTNYNGVNLMDKLYDIFMNEEEPNPYTYQYVNAAYAIYDKDATKEEAALAKLKEAVLESYVDGDNGTGIDYWGVSADNNGNILTALKAFYKADTDIKTKADKAITWTMQQADTTGAIVSWGAANPDSTGQALRLCAEYEDLSNAKTLYEGTKQFKSSVTTGAYTYGGKDNSFATVDILWGLVAYDKALDGQWIFEVEITEETTTEKETTTETPTTKEESTTAVTIDKTVEVDGAKVSVDIVDVSGILPAGAKLTVERVTSSATFDGILDTLKKNNNVVKMEMFELNINEGEVSALTGNVKVSIDIPATLDKTKTLVVYRVEEDGKMTALETIVKDGKVVFETNHFSTYIIAEVAEKTTVEETTTTVVKTETTTSAKEAAKTGDSSSVMVLFGAAVASCAIVMDSRKKSVK